MKIKIQHLALGIAIIVAFFNINEVKCNSFSRHIQVDVVQNTTELFAKWNSFQKKLETLVQRVLKEALPVLLSASRDVDISDTCSLSLTKTFFGLGQMKPWALKMIDAMGKLPSGIMDGTFASLGAFDQCLDVEVNPDNDGGFIGQYCTVTIRPPLPPRPKMQRLDKELEVMKNFTTSNLLVNELKKNAAIFYQLGLRVGVCVPSVCTRDDVQKIAQSVAEHVDFFARVTDCEVKTKLVVETNQIIIICVLLVFIILVVSATALHVFIYNDPKDIRENKNLKWELIRSFSIPYNVPKILETKIDPDQANLTCLHGLKVISMTWVILGHTYVFFNYQALNNMYNAYKYIDDPSFQAISNALVSVEVFFFVSGVLLCNIVVKGVNKYGLRVFNVPIIIAKRLWRLIPSALLTIGLLILSPLVGSGPFWQESMDGLIENCIKNWWAVALSVNNFLEARDMCIHHTWYISCEFQLFLCSLLFLWLLLKKPCYGYTMAIGMILVSIVAPGIATYLLDLPPTLLVPYGSDIDLLANIATYTYLMPYSHSGSYGLGLLLGYYLATRDKIRISMSVRLVGWMMAFILTTSILYGTTKWNQGGVPTELESVAYASLYRLGFVLGVAWVTLNCASGYGGYVNSILAWKGFIPLSRLTYLVYLLHFIVLWCQSSSLRSTVDARHAFAVWIFFGNLVGSLIVAFAVKIFFDSPLKELESVLLRRFVMKKAKELGIDSDLNTQQDLNGLREKINTKL